MRKIAIYCRVSTDEQAKNKEGSITSQIQRLRMKVEEKNHYENGKWGKVVDLYKDEAYSGKNTDRPEFQRLIADIKKKRIDTVMVTELSRLSRSVADFLNFINDMEKLGCDFICLQYDFDTTSPAGRVFMTIIMALAQFERELTAERIKNNFHSRALRGLLNGGHPFLGYDKDTKNSGRLILNKKEANLVKEIFNLYFELGSISAVAHELNKRGFVNKYWVGKDGQAKGGNPFNHDHIWRTLTNPAYMGKREINKNNKDASTDLLKSEEQYMLVDASWEPIVSEELFNQAQDKLNMNKQVKSAPKHDFIFSGLLTCDECGSPLFGQSGNGRNGTHFYYGHKGASSCRIKRYPAVELESLIKKQAFSFLNNQAMKEHFVETLKDMNNSRPKVNQSLVKMKEKELEKTQAEIDQLVTIMATNSNAARLNSLISKLEDSEKRLSLLKEETESLKQKLDSDQEREIDVDYLLGGIDLLRSERFRKANLAKKREILRNIVKTIHLNPENVIMVDFWGSERQSEAVREAHKGQSGVVLPFRKLGRPLEASFGGADCGEKMAEIKKAAEIGTYLGGFLMDDGSSSVRFGGRDRNRTCDPQHAMLMLSQLSYTPFKVKNP